MSVVRRWAEAILARLLDHPLRDEVLGDLGEELAREGHGFTAHLRYLGSALAIVTRVQWARLTEGPCGPRARSSIDPVEALAEE
jgi:hypothetical protein